MDWQQTFSRVSTHQQLNCDVLVAGGGIAGVCAALSAARGGAKVVLCQDRSVLGGNASSEIRMHICGADFLGNRSSERPVEARETGIIEEIRLENAVRNPQRSWSMHDLILYEKCMAEPNLTLLLDTAIVGVELNGRMIKKAFAIRSCTEDCFTIEAGVFIDCTGDGRMGAEAGAGFSRGRETAEAFGEPGAPAEKETGEMGMSLLFEAQDMGRPMPFEAPKWARKFTEKELSLRDCSKFNYGYWWIEWGGYKDTIKELPLVREKLLAILMGVWDYIKNSGKFDADNYALQWFGFLPGKRQSRRFKGLYTLTENDLKKETVFYDTIAYGGWPFDSHPPSGIDSNDEEPSVQADTSFVYPIPLRSCISSDIDNLMFAGRNISASYIAFSSTRVMATCGVIGQGVGTAAAWAAANSLSLQKVLEEKNIRHVQDKLLDDDCFLPLISRHQKDIVLSAKIRASSQTQDGLAENVKTSLTRSTAGLLPGDNQEKSYWQAGPESEMPQWLELEWHEAVSFNEIRIVFDSGLYRPLTLTHDKLSGMDEKMIWAAQPETISDYRIQYETSCGWKELIAVKGNYQRLNIHVFEQITANKLRLCFDKTNGSREVRVCRLSILRS